MENKPIEVESFDYDLKGIKEKYDLEKQEFLKF